MPRPEGLTTRVSENGLRMKHPKKAAKRQEYKFPALFRMEFQTLKRRLREGPGRGLTVDWPGELDRREARRCRTEPIRRPRPRRGYESRSSSQRDPARDSGERQT